MSLGGSSSSKPPLLRLPTAERERETELEEWAKDIFGAFGGKKPVKKAPLLTDAYGRDCWPSSDAATAALTTSIDELETLKRRAVHAIRNLLVGTFCWVFGQRDGAAEDEVARQSAAALAHAAILAHVETSAIRKLVAAARKSQGLWWALRSGRLAAGAAVTIPADLLEKHCTLWCSLSSSPSSSSSSSSSSAAVASFGSQREAALWKAWKQEPESDNNGRFDFLVQQLPKDGEADMEEPRDPFSTLRPYQRAALEAVVSANPSNCCVVLPCGAGKTKVGSSVVAEYLMENPTGCVMVLCLRREGIRQWGRELQEVWEVPSLEATGQILEEELRASNIILATYHRLLSERRREAKGAHLPGALRRRFLSCSKGLLIADECHMVPAPKIQGLLRELLGLPAAAAAPEAVAVKVEAGSSAKRLVGLTATLLREGGEGEEDEDNWPLLGMCVHKETFAALAPEYLAPVRCVEVRVPVLGAYEQVFEDSPLSASVCLSRGKWQVLEHLLAKHPDEQMLITVERCEQARMIATAFGIVPIDGSVSAGQIKDILDRFRRCKIRALVATHILDDSADFPELSVMVQMGGFFASRRQEQQRLGRLLRWGPEKRKRWEQSKERPTFYVLVHDGTVEEQMSKHRTSSVQGIEYERVEAADLMAPPMSPLPCSDVIEKAVEEAAQVVARAGSEGATLAQYYERLAEEASSQESQRLETCRRTAQRWMIEGRGNGGGDGEGEGEAGGSKAQAQRRHRGGGEGDGQLSLADIRAWLAGGKKTPEQATASSPHLTPTARSPSSDSESGSSSYSYYYSDSYSGDEESADEEEDKDKSRRLEKPQQKETQQKQQKQKPQQAQGQGQAQGPARQKSGPHPSKASNTSAPLQADAQLSAGETNGEAAKEGAQGRGRGRGRGRGGGRGEGRGGRGRGRGRGGASVAGCTSGVGGASEGASGSNEVGAPPGANPEAVITPDKRKAAAISNLGNDDAKLTAKKARSLLMEEEMTAVGAASGSVAPAATATASATTFATSATAAAASTTSPSQSKASQADSKQPSKGLWKFGKLQSNLSTSAPIDLCLD